MEMGGLDLALTVCHCAPKTKNKKHKKKVLAVAGHHGVALVLVLRHLPHRIG